MSNTLIGRVLRLDAEFSIRDNGRSLRVDCKTQVKRHGVFSGLGDRVVGAPSVLSAALARLTEVTESGGAEKRRFFQKVSVSGLPGIASIIWEPKISGAVVYFAADRTVSRKAKHRKRS